MTKKIRTTNTPKKCSLGKEKSLAVDKVVYRVLFLFIKISFSVTRLQFIVH
jgi:hypothetical protein